jgi:hypothetical protein
VFTGTVETMMVVGGGGLGAVAAGQGLAACGAFVGVVGRGACLEGRIGVGRVGAGGGAAGESGLAGGLRARGVAARMRRRNYG